MDRMSFRSACLKQPAPLQAPLWPVMHTALTATCNCELLTEWQASSSLNLLLQKHCGRTGPKPIIYMVINTLEFQLRQDKCSGQGNPLCPQQGCTSALYVRHELPCMAVMPHACSCGELEVMLYKVLWFQATKMHLLKVDQKSGCSLGSEKNPAPANHAET